MILSLQGCMAVGKTIAVRYLQNNAPYINISYEINADIVEEVKRRQLNKNKFEHHLKYLLPLKRKWFYEKNNVDVLMIDNLSKEEMGIKVKEWCDYCIQEYE